MGFRVKPYGPWVTIVIVGSVVSTRVPALVNVTIAQIASANPAANTITPIQTFGHVAEIQRSG
jgi:hypothetical protein